MLFSGVDNLLPSTQALESRVVDLNSMPAGKEKKAKASELAKFLEKMANKMQPKRIMARVVVLQESDHTIDALKESLEFGYEESIKQNAPGGLINLLKYMSSLELKLAEEKSVAELEKVVFTVGIRFWMTEIPAWMTMIQDALSKDGFTMTWWLVRT